MNTTELTVSVSLTLSELIDLKVTVGSAMENWQRLGCDYSARTAEGILAKLNDAHERFYKQLEEDLV